MSNIFIHLIEVQIEIGFNGIHSNVEVGFHQAHVIKHVSNPRRFTIKGLSALLRGAFTPSSLSCWLRLNFFFLFFTFTLIIFNFFEKGFHILIVTKVMLPNPFFCSKRYIALSFWWKIHQEAWVWLMEENALKNWAILVTTPPMQMAPTRLSLMSYNRHWRNLSNVIFSS